MRRKTIHLFSRFQIQFSSPLRLEEEKQGKRLPEFSLLSARSRSLSLNSSLWLTRLSTVFSFEVKYNPSRESTLEETPQDFLGAVPAKTG